MTSDKTSRWLDLVAFLLQHRFPVTREQIFRQVGGYDGAEESARRKFERDKDELRAMGIEIETVPITNAAGDEPATGYRLRPRQAYLPYLELLDAPSSERLYHGLDRIVLSRAELEVLDHATRALAEQAESALASAAASARRKLAFDLPLESSSLRRILATPLPGHVRDALAVLQDAIIRRVAVSCRFTTPRSKDTIHVLQPWGLIFQWNRWYCVALASDHHEPRLVRVDRMRDVHLLTGPDASFSVPDDFDVRNFVGHWPWEFGNDQLVTTSVRFQFPESRWLVNRGVGEVVRENDDQSVELRFPVRDRDAFMRWLLSFGRQAELIAPDAFRESLVTLRADVAALYAESIP